MVGLVITYLKTPECHLRFSSIPFDLGSIHTPEASKIHLCNNSIQKSATVRPTDEWADGCMWSSDRYKEHLAEQVSQKTKRALECFYKISHLSPADIYFFVYST